MKRTHRIRVYRPGKADPYSGSSGWTPGAEYDANLQPLTGSVQQSAAGREIGATWRAFVPAGAQVKEDDGIQVLEGVGPERYRVVQAGPQGAPWDTELMLSRTVEVFD